MSEELTELEQKQAEQMGIEILVALRKQNHSNRAILLHTLILDTANRITAEGDASKDDQSDAAILRDIAFVMRCQLNPVAKLYPATRDTLESKKGAKPDLEHEASVSIEDAAKEVADITGFDLASAIAANPEKARETFEKIIGKPVRSMEPQLTTFVLHGRKLAVVVRVTDDTCMIEYASGDRYDADKTEVRPLYADKVTEEALVNLFSHRVKDIALINAYAGRDIAEATTPKDDEQAKMALQNLINCVLTATSAPSFDVAFEWIEKEFLRSPKARVTREPTDDAGKQFQEFSSDLLAITDTTSLVDALFQIKKRFE